MSLIIAEPFISHSGLRLPFKIDCDALTDQDLEALAKIVSDEITFNEVIGIPTGGVRFAAQLSRYAIPRHKPVTTLLVDDVLTTGKSMQGARELFLDKVLGVVIFARGPYPDWIVPIFKLESFWQ